MSIEQFQNDIMYICQVFVKFSIVRARLIWYLSIYCNPTSDIIHGNNKKRLTNTYLSESDGFDCINFNVN